MAEHVTICEMSPRDGLQNEPRIIPTFDKIALVDALSACGFSYIEVTSFVSSKWVPQMADGAQVLAGIKRRKGVTYAALVPNLAGYAAARAAGADEVAIFAAASETFSQRNINCSISESLARFATVAAEAGRDGIGLRGYVSCVADCPYEGPVRPEAVAEVASALRDLGCREVSLGDTTGHGTPQSVAEMLDAVAERIPVSALAGHFHDTAGRALENIEIALARGLRVFDASCGGLGGCPFAPGAAGNAATESVADRLVLLGFDTGLDLDMLGRAARLAKRLRLPGVVP